MNINSSLCENTFLLFIVICTYVYQSKRENFFLSTNCVLQRLNFKDHAGFVKFIHVDN